MHRLQQLLQRFHRDERGVFAVFFALIALVLIATSGAVVDFTSIQQTRTRAQTALDSAALALQPTITVTGVTATTLKAKAQLLLTERLADSSVTATVTAALVDIPNGTLEFDATVSKQTAFVRMVGITSLSANLISQATRKQLDLEVAMVLDNSISMNSSSRMTNLKKAARCATDILFNAITSCTDTVLNNSDSLSPTVSNVRVGIVPFTEFVNVGASHNADAWMDTTGASAVSKSGFDSDDYDGNVFNTAVNRFSLYTQMNVSWEGCVDARNHVTGTGGYYYDTQDLKPDPTIPDSLYSPNFAADQPDGGGYANDYMTDTPSICTNVAPIWTWQQDKATCNKNAAGSQSNYNSASCTGSTTNAYTQKSQTGATVTPAATTQPATLFNNSATCSSTYTKVSQTGSSPNIKYNNRRVTTCTYNFSDRELQERLCKYNTHTNYIGSGFQAGPNADCGTSLLPLTTTKSSVITKIGLMGAVGATNIHQGLFWGYATLSPDAPFTEGKAFSSATSKVMILMTDGENTAGQTANPPDDLFDAISWPDTDGWNLAYGYPYFSSAFTGSPYATRISGSSIGALQQDMDSKLSTTCTNAKTAGITIYTVGLAVDQTTNPTSVTTMLTNCASGSDHAYFPANSTDLVTVFQTIAGQLADLRLAR